MKSEGPRLTCPHLLKGLRLPAGPCVFLPSEPRVHPSQEFVGVCLHTYGCIHSSCPSVVPHWFDFV